MESYILIVDDEEDILEIHEMTVRSSFTGEVRTAKSGNTALRVIEENGTPRAIISDYRMPEGDGLFLLNSLKERSIQVPFIICSGNPLIDLKATFPNVHIITKPNIVHPMTALLESLLNEEVGPQYVPMKITQLQKIGYSNYDFYLRLSEKNFVKAIHKGEVFSSQDSERFHSKSIQELYLTFDDAIDYIKHFESYLELKQKSIGNPNEDIQIALESIESVEALARNLGWGPESVELAKETVNFAIKAISVNVEIFELLKTKFRTNTEEYAHHVGALALMTSAFCMQMGWTSESTQMKLAMASLLHDVTLDPKTYSDVHLWNRKAADPRDHSEQTIKYRNHPVEAVNLLYKMKNLPPDIDNIILNHHENTSASGFPRKIIASRISHLGAIFIIMEDLINSVETEPTQENIFKFIKDNEVRYSVGRFKNIFAVLKQSVYRHNN